MATGSHDDAYAAFVVAHEVSLRRALAGHVPLDAVADAVAEAFAYAWEHWERVAVMERPVGYLFRVAQSRSRRRADGLLPGPDPHRLPDVEPGLGPAVRALPPQQRSVVWLVVACGWTYGETAEALEITASSVGTHLTRAMTRLRSDLGVTNDA
ncbi:MAG: sigma-70 family RNA polymerase sigma factor [Acidimicrobiia bacterium]|nr:sigma-70 family RNA polymerase sigma factor [Acidimicrobiia bacterium]